MTVGVSRSEGAFLQREVALVVVVQVERRYTHPLFKKTVRRTKKYHAHDEANVFKVGDLVSIQESAPISKLKRWVALEKT